MKTAFLSFLLCGAFCYAEIIAGVAIRVNSHAITLNEIKSVQKEFKITKEQAIDMLINERLKDDEIERFKISVDEFKIDDEITRIAQSSGISKSELISQIAKRGLSYQNYRTEIKKQIQTRELMQKILSSNVSITDENELFAYYTKHKKEFEIPTSVSVMRYSAKSDTLLQKAQATPNKSIDGVEKIQEEIALDALSPEIKQVFVTTPKGEFTPVLNSGDVLVSFLILQKNGKTLLSFEQAKPLINSKLLVQKEQGIIKEHFDKMRASAKIVYIRE